jgi:hypothetical protein
MTMTNTNIDDEKDKFERPNDVVRRFYRRKRFRFFRWIYSLRKTQLLHQLIKNLTQKKMGER